MTVAPLRWLGNMSYYQVHSLVVRVGAVLRVPLLPTGMPGCLFWALMPATFGATLAASALLFVAVEKPIWLRPKAAALPPPSATASAAGPDAPDPARAQVVKTGSAA